AELVGERERRGHRLGLDLAAHLGGALLGVGLAGLAHPLQRVLDVGESDILLAARRHQAGAQERRLGRGGGNPELAAERGGTRATGGSRFPERATGGVGGAAHQDARRPQEGASQLVALAQLLERPLGPCDVLGGGGILGARERHEAEETSGNGLLAAVTLLL